MITQTYWIVLIFLSFYFQRSIQEYLIAVNTNLLTKRLQGGLFFGLACPWHLAHGYFSLRVSSFFEYITSYKIEKVLSLDNVMVFAVIFKSLNIPTQYQHRVLFIGILSAIVMRALMIFLGVELLERFSWLLYIFGAFLIFTGMKIFS